MLKVSSFVMAAALVLAAAGAQAQAPLAPPPADAVLIEGNGLKLTVGELQGALLRLRPEDRRRMLADKGQLALLLNELFSRRLLAQRARARGLDQGPGAAALMQLSQEAVLADLEALAIDADVMPSAKQLAERARARYDKDPKPFARPALTHASHILVRAAPNDREQERKKAEELLAKLHAGGDFEALAREHSDDPGSAARGGDLGRFPDGRMDKAFEEALAKLKPGETSGLVETRFGYHIIRLHERLPAGTMSFEEVRERLEAQERVQALEEGRKRELDRLTKDTLIKGDTLDQLVQANRPAAQPKAAPGQPAAKASAAQ